MAAATGRPGVGAGDMPPTYIRGYLNEVRSSRMAATISLERRKGRLTQRQVELLNGGE